MVDKQFQHSTGMMLIPEPWPCWDDQSHCTLVYAGHPGDEVFAELLWKAEVISSTYSMIETTITGQDKFGKYKAVHAYMLRPTVILRALRDQVRVYSASPYEQWRPHISAKQVPHWELPEVVRFPILQVWHNGGRYPFDLKAKETETPNGL